MDDPDMRPEQATGGDKDLPLHDQLDLLTQQVRLLRALAEVTRLASEPAPLQDTMTRVVEVAARTLAGCEVGVLLTTDPPGRLQSAGSSAERAARLDAEEIELGEGPCAEALATQQEFHLAAPDFEARWPRWGPKASERGVREILALPFVVQGESRGALNVYGFEPDALNGRNRRLATLLAEQAAVGLANAQLFARSSELARNLTVALETRGVIEQAKGVLMMLRRCDEDGAFEALRRASQDTNVKVRDLARHVMEQVSGAAPPLAGPAADAVRVLVGDGPPPGPTG